MTNAMSGIEPPRRRDLRAVGKPEAPRGCAVAAQGAAQRSLGFPRPTMVSPERATRQVLSRHRHTSASSADIVGEADRGFYFREDWAALSGLVVGLDAYPGRAPWALTGRPFGAGCAEAVAWTVVANVLLNLDGVLTKG